MAEDYLLLDEVAELARVSVDTVRFWIRAHKLASVRPGRRRMVRREVLDAFLEQDSGLVKHDSRSAHPSAEQRRSTASQATPPGAPDTSRRNATGRAPNELERKHASKVLRRSRLSP